MGAWYQRRYGILGKSGLGPPSGPPGAGRGKGPPAGRGPGRGRGRPGRGIGNGNGGVGPSTLNTTVVRAAANTSTGTQDFTSAGFGTPKAAIIEMVGATADGTATDTLRFSLGAVDGTNEWAMSSWSNHSDSTINAANRSATDVCAMIWENPTFNGAGIMAEAAFDSFITDGVRINWTTAPPSAWLVKVTLIGGADISASVGTQTLATENNVVTVSPGFETHALFTALDSDAFNDTGNAHNNLGIGFGSYDGTTIRQGFAIIGDRNDQTTTESGGIARNDAVTGRVNHAVEFGYASLENITSTSFDLRSLGGDLSGFATGYLALSLADEAEVWAGVVDSPTATGDHTFSSPGFQPSVCLMVPTMLDALTTHQADGRGSVIGLGTFNAGTEFCSAVATEDGASVSDTECASDDAAIYLNDHTGTSAFRATFVSFAATGPQLNFTDADGTARKWPMLAIQ